MPKAPLGERLDNEEKWIDRKVKDERWTDRRAKEERWTDRKLSGRDSAAKPDPRSQGATRLAPVNTSRGPGKRGRDAAPPRPPQRSSTKPPAPDGYKKSRPMPDARTQDRPVDKKPAGARPRMDRRVGGIAPNGNPQCWFAPDESEGDPHRVAQRSKQIEYGKNSDGYKAYVAAVPKCDSLRVYLCMGCGAEQRLSRHMRVAS